MTVDILFPFYGDVAMMKEAVRSVLRQTNPNWRLIVVDDGYPDESIPGWFDSLKDSRVTYMRNETNLGANGNYRKCLTFVENPLVQVMGADDVMLPNYVDWLVGAGARHPDATIFQPGVFVIDAAMIPAARPAVTSPRGASPSTSSLASSPARVDGLLSSSTPPE